MRAGPARLTEMAYDKLRRAFDAGLFDRELCEIAAPPTQQEIDDAESDLGLPISDELRQLLLAWGGSDLHEIRIHSAAELSVIGGLIAFATDYSGSLFMTDPEDGGAVYADDAHSGETIYLAPSVSAFVDDFLLGPKGEDFYGEDWVRALRENGLA